MTRRHFIWPAILIGSAAGLWALILAGNVSTFRALVAMWFFLVCPGMAYMLALQIKNTLERWALALALSFVIDALVALAILYLGIWSWELGLNITIVIMLAGIGIYFYRLRMSTRQMQSPVEVG